MALGGTIYGDLQVLGNLLCKQLVATQAAITDAMVSASAGIQASKCQQQFQPVAVLTNHATAATPVRVQIHRANGATGTVQSFKVVPSVACTVDATVTITLKKNGSAILSSSIVMDATTVAFAAAVGTLGAGASYVAGDVFEAEITAVSAGAGAVAKGVSCHMVTREDAS